VTEQDPRDEPGTTPAPDHAAAPAPGTPAAGRSASGGSGLGGSGSGGSGSGGSPEPVVPRHRKAGAAALTSWLAVLQRPDRRGLLIVGGVLVVLLLLAVGYVALIASDLGDGDRRPGAAGSAAPSGAVPSGAAPSGAVPSGAVPSGAAPSASSGASDAGDAGPSATAAPGDGDDEGNDDGKGNEDGKGNDEGDDGRGESDNRPEPRLVGPSSFDGFTKLLSAFCKDRGQRTAVLLEGPGYNPKTGNWACTKVTTFTEINLDEACREQFGAESQARQTTRRDSRTWRCFDR
jgi:hypothetical protein